MKYKLNRVSKTIIASLLLGGASFAAHAEITLIKQDPQPDDLLSRLNFKVGGSIRPQVANSSGKSDAGSYKHNGYDAGSRFRFSADYFLFDDIHWVSYYELGVNFPKVFKWDKHYADGAHDTTRRQLYTGLKSKTYGQLTFGQQNSIYYDVVGAKTDNWNNDMNAQAPGNGINGDYDGSYRSRKMLKYKISEGPVDLYAAALLKDTNYYVPSTNNNIAYKRKGGGSVGSNWQITNDLSLGTAYNYTRAEVTDRRGNDGKNYNQSIIGSALNWAPGRWDFSVGGGYYHNFLTNKNANARNYFADSAYGVEYYASYIFPINSAVLKSVKPYVMGDYLKYTSGRDYSRTDDGIGVQFKLAYNLSVTYEHQLINSSDNLGDVNSLRLTYDF